MRCGERGGNKGGGRALGGFGCEGGACDEVCERERYRCIGIDAHHLAVRHDPKVVGLELIARRTGFGQLAL